MAALDWLRGEGQPVIPFGTSVRVGCAIRVRGRNYEAGKTPTHFDIFRGYGPLARRFLARRRRPTETYVQTLLADPPGPTPTIVVSESGTVPTKLGSRLRAPLFVRDSIGNLTNPIYATRLGSFDVGPQVNVGGFGGGLGSIKFTTAVDPDIDFQVVLPWRLDNGDDGVVQDLIDEVASDLANWNDDVDYESAKGSLLEEVSWALPNEPLPGWSIEVLPRQLSLDSGQSAEITMRFTALTPGAAAFAIQARGLLPNGEIAISASEIFVLEVGSELGQVSVSLL